MTRRAGPIRIRLGAAVLSVTAAFWALAPAPAWAKWVWTSDTGLVNTKDYAGGDPVQMYQRATALFQAGQYDDAAAEFTSIALFAAEPAYREKANAMVGEALFKGGHFHKAYEAFEDYLYNYPRTGKLRDILRRELDCAFQLMNGAHKELLGLAILPGRSTGLRIAHEVLSKYPYERFSDEYHFMLANFFYNEGSFADAADEYDQFLKLYPNSDWSNKAHFLLANSRLRSHQGTQYDQTPLTQAKKEFERYLRENPNGDERDDATKQLAEVNMRMAEKDFSVAMFYKKRGRLLSTAYYLRGVAQQYPDTPWAQQAKDELDRMAPELAALTPETPELPKAADTEAPPPQEGAPPPPVPGGY